MLRICRTIPAIALLWTAGIATRVQAALPIELEVAAQSDAPFAAMQDWHKVLAEMDLASVRLRGARGAEEPSIKSRELAGSMRFELLGVLNRKNELVLPGGRFGLGDRTKLKQFFEGLPARHAEAGVERGRFGLTREQFEVVFRDLSRQVTESTVDGSPRELLPALTKDFNLQVRGAVEMKAKLREAPPIRAQLQGLSTGTALAAVLRVAGLQFVPKQYGSEPLVLYVEPLDAAKESWPVGWAPPGSPRSLAPAIYQIRNIEIGNYTLAAGLQALGPLLEMPLVTDEYTIAARAIDPAQIKVKFPRSKTYIRRAVDSILSQGRLAGELRIDEAGKPFYWVTQFGKDSPRATKFE
jgi:hypothetical protein